MHIAFRKNLANGTVNVTSAGNWDGLKYQLSKLDYHDTDEWDRHFAWENFRSGYLINDGTGVWVYVNFEVQDKYDFEVFEGRLIFLSEVDTIFDEE